MQSDFASRLNARLAAAHPAATACLSALGRRLYYPKGIPAQAADAGNCALNATIGQVTDGDRQPLPPRAMTRLVPNVEARRAFLYAPSGGFDDLRKAWQEHVGAQGWTPASPPVVTSGITHAISVVADLFSDEDTTVLVPKPAWGNYQHIFGTRRGARVVGYPLMTRTGLDIEGIGRAVDAAPGKAVLVLNFPGNPTGYTPTNSEAKALVARLLQAKGPLVVVLDDAYLGMYWEPGLMENSLFAAFAQADPTRILAVKVDGATKELGFFGGRVGFISFGGNSETGAVLTEKAIGSVRATISVSSSLPQTLVLAALRDPNLVAERQAVWERLRRRYQALKDSLAAAGIATVPFNSGLFALIPVTVDPEALRQALLADGVGVIALPDDSAIRVSYGGVPVADIPRLVAAIARRLS
jgi:aspartate/methionine/tyrosine aminotransferase